MLFLEERYGREVVVPLAEELALVNTFAAGAGETVDAVFEAHIKATRDDIEAEWLAWLQEEFPDGPVEADTRTDV